MKKFKEWVNIQLVKNPGRMVLAAILLFNIVFFLIASFVISNLSLSGTEKMGFLEAAFCTITMILDAGCIQFVVADIGTTGVMVVVVCLLIILIGMISFTGAVIGYITNYISNFIENSNTGVRRLKVSNHTVILNWNTRASEIINDLLYCDDKQRVVVLVDSHKEEIEKEIQERLADTVSRENKELERKSSHLPFVQRKTHMAKHKFRKTVDVIVREGDIFSAKQLHDISLEYARMIVILDNDYIRRDEWEEGQRDSAKGNVQTVKILMQVADITAAEYSSDNQKIIVEITDEGTGQLVDRIIKRKQVEGKCNIVPVKVNQVLGHILSQFSLMPELNLVYRELFSNKGATFYTEERAPENEKKFISQFLNQNNTALPLTFMNSKNKSYFYYASESERDIKKQVAVDDSNFSVKLNRDYWIERKNIIILGHNSRCEEIMKGFESFRAEWGYKVRDEEIVRVVVIDDKKNLEKMGNYEKYPFVIATVPAEIYDKDRICSAIDEYTSTNQEDTSILILSDDTAPNDEIDANALANLVYVQDIIRTMKENNPTFDEYSIDVVVEIINPKHHDIVNSYSVNNVVISNRYISKMITQIGEKEALFDFYTDILTYDSEDAEIYESKEIYIKKANRFFDEIPGKCTAEELVNAVYSASVDSSIPENKQNPSMVLGYVSDGSDMILFSGDRSRIPIELTEKDKLIIFSNH